MGEWRYSILNLGARWSRVVSFTPRPLHPRYLFHRSQDRSPRRSESSGEEKKSLSLPGMQSR